VLKQYLTTSIAGKT